MDKSSELMGQFKQPITWSMQQSSKLIKEARAKLQTSPHLSPRILRQTKITFSPSLLELSLMNYLQKPLKLKLRIKNLLLSQFKIQRRRKKRINTLALSTLRIPSRCTLTVWPSLPSPLRLVFPPRTPTRLTRTCGSQCLILEVKSTLTFSQLQMAMANTERKSVASSRKCCHSTLMHNYSSWWKNTKRIWKKVERRNSWIQMRYA